MTVKQIDEEKGKLLNEVNLLSKKKKKLYGNIDISKPKSKEEKELDAKIAKIFSRINDLVRMKKALKS
jgi:hypothetical protein